MAALFPRMVRAARLDVNLYEEVEADEGATGQAMAVVILSSLAAGIGFAFRSEHPLAGALFGLLSALFGWILWAGLTYVIGARLFPQAETRSSVWELLRTIGFSSSPGVLRVFGFLPWLGPLLGAVAAVWMLVAMVIAVRQALDYTSTLRAVGVCLLGWVAQLLFMLIPLALVPALSRGG